MPDTELPRSQQTTNETGQAYETACFQTLDNRLRRAVIAEKRETSLVSHTVTLAFFLSEGNSQSTAWGWGAQSTGSCSAEEPDLRAQGYESSARHATSAGQVGEVRERCRERSPVNRRVGSPRPRGHIPTAQSSGEGPWGRAESKGWRLADNWLLQLILGTTSTCSNHLRVEKPQYTLHRDPGKPLLQGESCTSPTKGWNKPPRTKMINKRTAYQDKIQPFLISGQQNPVAQQPSSLKDTYIQPHVTGHTGRQGNAVWT